MFLNIYICSKGHFVHNWKARWFVLLPEKLLYYKYEGSKRDSCQRGKILLKDCVLTCPFLEYENRPVSCCFFFHFSFDNTQVLRGEIILVMFYTVDVFVVMLYVYVVYVYTVFLWRTKYINNNNNNNFHYTLL